ncbi:MAG: NAD(P)H-hydrate dehydratase [Clostridia bacterium]|nr:NAD(P)H-hydrate dehydratase [Clostridia bacterium]
MKVLTYKEIKSAEIASVNSQKDTFTGLMEKAGNAAAKEILNRYDVKAKKVNILIGGGNNGGDGLVIAEILNNAGAEVCVTAPFGLPDTETASAFQNCVSDLFVSDEIVYDADFYIDALFGIGLNRPLEKDISDLIDSVNNIDAVKIAIDIPSGLYADGGCNEVAFCADLTITFIGYKISMLLPDTSSFCGEIVLFDFGIIPRDYSYSIIEKKPLIKRDKNSHKGTFGTVFALCGSYGMCGASVLSAKAAVRSGAGIVKAVIPDKNYTAFTISVPEAVTIPVETAQNGAMIVYDKVLLSGLSSSKSCLIGPGIGTTDEAAKLLSRLLIISEIPTIIDADGINALAKDINILYKTKAPVIITPHPAEMARLCETTVSDIEQNRIRYAKFFAKEYNVIVVLKGANTIVSLPNGELFFNITGNPGMATAGSGDVLSGIIAAYLSMGYSPVDAVKMGVYNHGEAGDIAAKKCGENYMSATDIIKGLKDIR